jgi:hypothetical protein
MEANELLHGLHRVVELGRTREMVLGTYAGAGRQLEKLQCEVKIAELEELKAGNDVEKATARQVCGSFAQLPATHDK